MATVCHFGALRARCVDRRPGQPGVANSQLATRRCSINVPDLGCANARRTSRIVWIGVEPNNTTMLVYDETCLDKTGRPSNGLHSLASSPPTLPSVGSTSTPSKLTPLPAPSPKTMPLPSPHHPTLPTPTTPTPLRSTPPNSTQPRYTRCLRPRPAPLCPALLRSRPPLRPL